MKKIEIFGDSVLKGVVYKGNNKYALCGNNKFDFLEKDGFKVKNNSRMGSTVLKGSELLSKKSEEIEEGTVVLCGFGSNDCDYDWSEVSESPEEYHSPRLEINDFKEGYIKFIKKIRSLGGEPVVVIPVPVDSDKFLDKISEGKNRGNIVKFLGDTSMIARWQEYYSRTAERIAYELKCRILDLRTPFLVSHRIKNLLCADGMHPTEEGHKLIQNTIRDFLLNMK